MTRIGKRPSHIVAVVTLAAALVVGSTQPLTSKATSAVAQPVGYSVFSKQRTSADIISDGETARAMSTRIGFKVETARFVTRRGTVNIYAAEGLSGGACLVSVDDSGTGGAGCSTPDVTAVAGGWHGSIGLVPDDVDYVTFTMTDGTTQDDKVRDNVWVAPLEAARVRFATSGDTRTIQLMPRSSMPDNLKLCDNGAAVSKGESCDLVPNK